LKEKQKAELLAKALKEGERLKNREFILFIILDIGCNYAGELSCLNGGECLNEA
jgi:hypothetical protein